MDHESLHILISPLDWGLGHASRCIPVINKLLQSGHQVTIAGYGRSLIMLQKEFPTLECIEMKGFSPSYPESGNMVMHMLFLLPNFIKSIIQEHSELKELDARYQFDIIISDNRYGVWKSDKRSIFITHQLMIKTPKWLRFAEYLLYKVSVFFISRFDECWIPDYEESPGLSGDLSHKYKLPRNARFIGPLSRFQKPHPSPCKDSESRKITVIISGPEPQRSILEGIITRQLQNTEYSSFIISGKPESEKSLAINENLTILSHLPTEELCNRIISSDLIICRSGYSSIMDLHVLNAKALFVPTPGQTEQIYLAELHEKEQTAMWQTQEILNIAIDVPKALNYRGFVKNHSKSELDSAINSLKKK